MAEALIWLHGFGGGVFVGVLVGIWLGLANRNPDGGKEVPRG